MESIDPFVQNIFGFTNGRHYLPLTNKPFTYPIPEFPFPPSKNSSVLDIGCNWGRWMISASNAGYAPVGLDINYDSLKAATRVLKSQGIVPSLLLADLKHLPFKGGSFEYVFSYSNIQHTHKERAIKCIHEIRRVILLGGQYKLQFPTRHGFANILKRLWLTRFSFKHYVHGDEDDYESLCVKYYSIGELNSIFLQVFDNCRISVDCFIGIGFQQINLRYVPIRFRILIIISSLLKYASRYLPFLVLIADSVFVSSTFQNSQRE